ncbi:MAG TPA: hypothetical protein VFW64_03615 [Pseudonocardiaceae bacterium]|nr:hypothetical protein [Pseudonocardiaceae bacterium]
MPAGLTYEAISMHRALEGADELLSKLRRYARPGPDKRPDPHPSARRVGVQSNPGEPIAVVPPELR